MTRFNCSALNKLFNINGIEEFDFDDIPVSNGYYHSVSSLPEIKKAISEAKKGKPSTFKGKKHRPESIAQMKRNLPDRKGTSFACPEGTNVMAAYDGEVIYAGKEPHKAAPELNNCVIIKHYNVYLFSVN